MDVGYPRRIAGNWGGLSRVDAAFVMDGATYLFGPGALLFAVPQPLKADEAKALEAGTLPRSLRRGLADHGVTVAVDATVEETADGWQVTADKGLRIALRRVAGAPAPADGGPSGTAKVDPGKVEVRCDDAPCYVRYSTRDYATPDPGHPRRWRTTGGTCRSRSFPARERSSATSTRC